LFESNIFEVLWFFSIFKLVFISFQKSLNSSNSKSKCTCGKYKAKSLFFLYFLQASKMQPCDIELAQSVGGAQSFGGTQRQSQWNLLVSSNNLN